MPERAARGAGAERAATPPPAAPPTTREFPAGSYIVRMDQPYSRIADALLDYQYWAPNDPQTRPYDDTGWTFPEGFGVQAVRVTDAKVLDAPMEPVKGDVKAPSGVTGTGTVFAINHNADNALITLRYKLEGRRHPGRRGAVRGRRHEVRPRLVRHQGRVAGAISTRRRTSSASRRIALAAAPSVKTHPARAARVAILHTWTQHADRRLVAAGVRRLQDSVRLHRAAGRFAKTANLRAKYDVIIFGPGGGQGVVEGTPMWRNADSVAELARDAEHRHLGADRRHPHRHGARRADAPAATSSTPAACSSASNSSADFAITNNFTYGVSVEPSGRELARRRIAAAHEARRRDEPDRLRRARQPRDVQRQRRQLQRQRERRRRRTRRRRRRRPAAAGGGRGGGPAAAARPDAARPTIRTSCRAVRPARASNLPPLPPPQTVQPWQYALPTEEQLKRNPAT